VVKRRRPELLRLPVVRTAVEKLIKRGQLRDPSGITVVQGLLVLDIDDHVDDETIAASRVRTSVVITSQADADALTEALSHAAPARRPARKPRR
jgi:hypothetical protein